MSIKEFNRISEKLRAQAEATSDPDVARAVASIADTMTTMESSVFVQTSSAAKKRHEKEDKTYKDYAEEEARRLREENQDRDVRHIAKDVYDRVCKKQDQAEADDYYTEETIRNWVYTALGERPLRGRPPNEGR